MENNEINKNLDIILSILKLRVKNAGGIKSYLFDAYQIDLSTNDIQMLLDKLKEDGLITIDNANSGRCYITTPGRLFEGYVTTETMRLYGLTVSDDMKKQQASDRIHQMEVDLAIVRNGGRLNHLTRNLVISTVVLAMIALAALLVPYFVHRDKEPILKNRDTLYLKMIK